MIHELLLVKSVLPSHIIFAPSLHTYVPSFFMQSTILLAPRYEVTQLCGHRMQVAAP